jgi:hypothetical protein
MALLASGWESAGEVVWIFRSVIVLLVAADASARCTLKPAANVARVAVDCGVCAHQCESGELQVIEFCVLPRAE